MKKSKGLICLITALCLLFGSFGAIPALGAREYAAEVSFCSVAVNFENEPYASNDMIFVPV